jgi:hypothetical protein
MTTSAIASLRTCRATASSVMARSSRLSRPRISAVRSLLHDGPLLEQSLKAAAGALIRLPRAKQYHPDRDRLAARFEQFRRAA